jgi:hypothetical protein
MSIEKEYYINEMNLFIQHITLIVLNSRIIQKTKKNLKTISIQLFSIEQKKNFDIEEIYDFIDDYMFLASPNEIRQSINDNNNLYKNYEIDIFIIQDNKTILIEKWYFSYIDEIEIISEKKELELQLSILTRSIYSITRLLPIFQLKISNLKIDYKAYKNYFSNNKFNGNAKFIEIKNKKFKIKIKVEYLFDLNILINNNNDNFNKFKRPRFYTVNLDKKSIPSFEVLLTEDEYDSYNQNTKRKDSKRRKLSHEMDNNILNFLSKEEIKNLSPDESISSSINSNDSIELDIKVENNSSNNNLMLNDIKEKYKLLKDKCINHQENNIEININKLYIYTILDFNFN